MSQEIAQLFENLYFAPAKYRQRYLNAIIRACPEELDWVIAVLVGSKWIPRKKVSVLKSRLLESIDTDEFERSKSFVGDPIECIAKLWSTTQRVDDSISIRALIYELKHVESLDPLWVFLDHSSEIVRWFVLKILFENPKWGIEIRNLWDGLADYSNMPAGFFESRWYGVEAPFEVIVSYLKGDREELVSVPEGVVFDPVFDFETRKIHEVEAQGIEDFQFLFIPKGMLVLVVVNEVRCAVFDENGREVSLFFPEVSKQAYPSYGSWVGLIEELSETEGECYIGNRLRRTRVTPSVCDSNPIRFRNLFRVKEGRLNAFEKGEWLCKTNESYVNFPVQLESWNAVDEVVGQFCFLKHSDSDEWIILKRDDQIAHLILLYCEKSPRSKGLVSLTLGFEEKGIWFPCVKVEPLFHLFDETRFYDWLKKNQVKKIGPIVEVNRTLIFSVQYESMIASKRRKAGFYLNEGKILQIEWDSSILDISNRKTLKQL